MNRATAIIGGVLLFGLGLFLGMVGSFVRTLAPEPSTTATTPAHAATTTNAHAGATHSRPATAPSSPSPMESALSETMAMVAVALATPPSTTPPPASEASGVTSPNAPEQPSLDTVVADAVDGPMPMDPLAAAASSPPPPMPSPNPLAGHWVFDPRLGWLWLPENNTTVVIVPMVEMFPAGLVIISRPARPVAAKRTAMSSSKSPSTPQPKGITPQIHTPSATPSTASPPSPGRR